MRRRIGIAALAAVVSTAATCGGPTRTPTTSDVASSWAGFARMPGGEWRLTLESGNRMFDTWSWGPGRHSIRRETAGAGAAGEPWRALEVVHRRPGLDEFRLFGLSPFARGVTEGTTTFDGDVVDAVFELHQTGARRDMRRRWVFDGPDRYRATLSEATGAGDYVPLGEWEYVRSETLTPVEPRADDERPERSAHLVPLDPFVGRTFAAEGVRDGADVLRVRSTVEWIPSADYVRVRAVEETGDGASIPLLDAYVYHHTGRDALRLLALSREGGVYEGDVIELEGGALRFDLRGHDGERVVEVEVRLDLEADGSVRQRVWALDGSERTPSLDVLHGRSGE
ncbi:MAG: hypothetical protein ACF8XB_14840 [Planctomycetota bacterium JB042]